MPRKTVVGLISDTHGLLRPEALDALRGSDLVVHAGDIGGPDILAELARLAPVHAVRGNVDGKPWAAAIPMTQTIEAGAGALVHVLHRIEDLDVEPATAGFRAVVSGHSHRPASALKDGVLRVNPGSAGPRRFSLPVTVGRLLIGDGEASFELVELRPAPDVSESLSRPRRRRAGAGRPPR